MEKNINRWNHFKNSTRNLEEITGNIFECAFHTERISVVDPDPDVFGPPGSGFFHQQAKKVSKTLISTIS
jgi:hypothetical protein